MGKRCLFASVAALILAAFLGAAPSPAEQAADPGLEPRAIVRIHLEQKGDMDRILQLEDLDIASARKNQWVDLVIHPERIQSLVDQGFNVEVRIPDIGKDRREQMGLAVIDFGNYYTYAEMIAQLDSLHATYPAITSAKVNIGTTIGGRTMWAFKVSDDPGTEDPTEAEVLFNGATHAREPIGCTLCVEFVRYLCQNYGVDSHITDLVNTTETWIIPVMNPDGYVYNETGDGWWRKNRRNNGDGTYGVDLNRNYGYQWGYDNYGSSPYTSDEDYRGTAGFSEPETQAVRNFFNAHEFAISVDYHSSGNLLLYPWSYINSPTADQAFFEAFTAYWSSFNGYTPGRPAELLYSVNGGSIDWEYGEQSTKPKCLAISPEVGEDFWQDSQISAQVLENRPGMIYCLELASGAVIDYQSHAIVDGGNGILDAGETADLTVTLHNAGFQDVGNVQATISEGDAYITLLDASGSYGTIAGQSSATNSADRFQVQAAAGTPVGHGATITLNITGDGGFSTSDTFILVVGQPPILLVDDDDGSAYQGYFQTAITNAGYACDTWTVTSQGSPAAGTLMQYSAVVWLTGDDWGETLSSADQTALTAYLGAGKHLFISGQDIGYDIGGTGFYTGYLKASYLSDNSYDTTLLGVAGDLISDGLPLTIAGGDGANNQAYPSIISASGGSTSCWTYNGSSVGAVRYDGTYKLVYMAFGFEAISTQADRDEAMTRILEWMVPQSEPPVDTVAVSLSCVPAAGTLPFTSFFSVELTNISVYSRRVAAHLDVTLAGGPFFSNYRSGFTNLGPAAIFNTSWNQTFPGLGTLVGPNVFHLVGEDVTQSPFNQPPYPVSGDTDTALATVTGVSP